MNVIQGEIEMMIKLGVSPKRIIYALPNKQISHILYAKSVGVDLMTFDNVNELHKIKEYYPNARNVLRIKVDDFYALRPLGYKFGAEMKNVPLLFETAKSLGLNIVGTSFHVGCLTENPISYTKAIADSRFVFNLGREYGFDMYVLDIGMSYNFIL